MRWLRSILQNIFFIIFLTGLQLAIRQLFPYPFNQLNLLLASLLVLLLLEHPKFSPLCVLASSIILEIFTAVPWGLPSFILLVTCLFVAFVLQTVFIQRSTLIAVFLALVATFFYRFALNFTLFITSRFEREFFSLFFLSDWALEAIFTSLAVCAGYGIVSALSPRLKPHYVF